MDRKIEKKKWGFRRIATISAVSVIVVFILFRVGSSDDKKKIEVDSKNISLAQVEESSFVEYAPVSGVVMSKDIVFLDLEEGGIVENIYNEGGRFVEKGELILSFSNSTIQKQTIDSETRVLENLDRLRSTKIALTEKRLLLNDKLLDLNYEIEDSERRIRDIKLLNSKSMQMIPENERETLEKRIAYLKGKRKLHKERIEQENILREQQSEQVDNSIARVKKSLQVLSQISDSLNVRAPISGFLSSMDVELGQSFQRGQRIGQIDTAGEFIVRADVDQFFISKVSAGLTGTFEFGGEKHQLKIAKVYPEVKNDVFQVDLEFVGESARQIKRGQTIQIDLGLSSEKYTKVVPKGSFYRYTRGRWVYVVNEEGTQAVKTSISPGKQNPKSLEIVKGLNVGDFIILSEYEKFNNADEVNFKRPITKLVRKL